MSDPLGEDDQYELTTTGSTLSESMATSEVIETATSVVETSGKSFNVQKCVYCIVNTYIYYSNIQCILNICDYLNI